MTSSPLTQPAPSQAPATETRAGSTLCASAHEQAHTSPPATTRFISLASLLQKLTSELRTTELDYSDLEVAARRGWNARTHELLAWLEGAK